MHPLPPKNKPREPTEPPPGPPGAPQVARELTSFEYVGHTDEVVAIALIPAPQISEKTASMSEEATNPALGSPRKNDEVMLFSASLDNTMRCWDEVGATCLVPSQLLLTRPRVHNT